MLRTVLIADDDRLLRESLCEVLQDLGYVTRPVGSGGDAIEILKHSRCDLVLSDVDMPDMTGFALLSWLHGHVPAAPAVLMSARADKAMDLAAHRAGAIALLPKPVAVTSLTSLVHHLFDA